MFGDYSTASLSLMTSPICKKPFTDYHIQILKRNQEGKDNAPEVIKEDIDGAKASAETMTFENLLAMGQMQNIANGGRASDAVTVGQNYGLPDLPLPPTSNLHYRYDPVISQVTNLLMKHGKLSVAQRVGSSVSP
jgi:small subunit ribosomal protein S7